MNEGRIKDFYTGKTVLLTGGTGYVGRLILAKFMRMGNLKEILLISRPKRGKTNQERLDYILSGFLFQEIEKYDKQFKSKLRIINGDMELEDLGLSVDDREYIKDNVEIIIHGAATVRFDEDLPIATAINIRGTKYLLDIGLEARKLQSFVHISTAYSNCIRSEINEEFYKPPMDYRQALKLLEVADCGITPFTEKIIAPWPNTYTFTKAIAEDVVRQYQDRLPIAVIRPTVVQSTLKDPVPGFVDKLIGPFGIAIGVVAGIVRVVKTNHKIKIDLIPIDIVVNSTLAIAWKAAEKTKRNEETLVFNCAINTVRQISISFCLKWITIYVKQFPTKKMIWKPTINEVSSIFMYRVLFVLYHYIPAFFYDMVLKFQGSKTRMMDIYNKVYYETILLDFFASRTWKFNDINMRQLHRDMSKEDHDDFPLTLRAEDYEPHTKTTSDGFRKYFFKENDNDLKSALKLYKLFNLLHNLLLAVIYGFIFYFVYIYFLK